MRPCKHISDVPELLAEWDFEKNQEVEPAGIAFRTHELYWWICRRGHSYKASPHNRAVGKGCPYCAGRKILQGFNDLASQRPALASEWDYEKNAGLSPEEVLVTSSKRAWWKCDKGHSWDTIVLVRSRYGCGCPYCSGHKVVQGYNDLATLKPELLSEWDYERNTDFTPMEISVFSAKRVWWKCAMGHRWRTAVANRGRPDGTGCPYCSNKKVQAGYNDIATVRPELLFEWDYEKNTDISPEEVSPGAGRIVWWKCKKGHSWQAPVERRKESGCPYCAGRKAWKGFNDVASQRPDLLHEWDYEKNTGVSPEEITTGSGRKVWWKCEKGHSWQMPPVSRKEGSMCPVCFGHNVVAGINDLATLCPEMVKQWDYDKNILYSPEMLSPSSNRMVWWLCENGHSWRISPNHRQRGNGCPYCANKKVLAGYNDLATFFPGLAAEWDYQRNEDFTPDQAVLYSQRSVYWKCGKGHSWRSPIVSRSRSGHGCPYCAGQRVIKGENDLATVDPKIASEWDIQKNAPLTPNQVMAGSSRRVWWKCEKGHSWKAAIHSRKVSGCPYCNNHSIEMKTSFIS